MKSNFDQSREGIRSQQRAKRRKTNIILNGLIGLVILLIIVVSVSIFSGNNDEKEVKQEQKVSSSESGNVTDKTSGTTKQNQKTKSQETADETTTEDEDSKVVTEGDGLNVKSTIINPAWEPVGTTQTGPFSSDSIDWEERETALAYAIGLDRSNMTVWYLTRNGVDQSIGTITAKGNPQAYRVYLEWKDGKGWMPTMVEELIENDKGQTSAN